MEFVWAGGRGESDLQLRRAGRWGADLLYASVTDNVSATDLSGTNTFTVAEAPISVGSVGLRVDIQHQADSAAVVNGGPPNVGTGECDTLDGALDQFDEFDTG